MKRICVLTSGGDAPGMNACLRAVVRMSASLGVEVLGAERGYDGLINGDLNNIGPRDVSDIIQRGGTIIRTARSEAFKTDEGFKRALAMLDTFKIEGVVVIGGNGSMAGAYDLEKAGVKVVFLPASIDNDLAYTDYAIGFDTAVNTALYAISNIRDTSAAHERVTIIEVMGRECGDIAVHSGLTGGAEIILIPEKSVDVNEICRTLIENRNKGKMSSIVVMAEGADIDPRDLRDTIQNRTSLDVKLVILGYIQRGGTPTSNDRLLASALGAKAAELLKEDHYGVALGFVKGKIITKELGEAMQMKKRDISPMYELAKVLAQ